MALKTKVFVGHAFIIVLAFVICFAAYANWIDSFLLIPVSMAFCAVPKLLHMPDFSQQLNSIKSYRITYDIFGIVIIIAVIVGISSGFISNSSKTTKFCFISILALLMLFGFYKACCEYKLASSTGQG